MRSRIAVCAKADTIISTFDFAYIRPITVSRACNDAFTSTHVLQNRKVEFLFGVSHSYGR